MAKRKGKKKGHRKNPKRVAAARRAWRNNPRPFGRAKKRKGGKRKKRYSKKKSKRRSGKKKKRYSKRAGSVLI